MAKILPFLCIVSAIPGFRRAGVAHPANKTYYEADYFTADQRKQLEAEPRITVTELEEVPEGAVVHAAATDKPRTATTGSVQGDTKSLNDMTVAELKEIAQGLGIEQFNSLKKAELIEAIEAVETAASTDTKDAE